MTGSDEAAEEDLLLAVHRLGRMMSSRRVATRIVAAAGGDVSQQGLRLLRALARSGELPVAGLAAAAHMDISAVSRQLRPLEAAGLVRRSSDREDGRVARVALTPAGSDLAERLRVVGVGHLSRAMSTWSASERAELSRLMTRLLDDLQATEIDPVDAPARTADQEETT